MKYHVSYFCDVGHPGKVNQDRVLVNGDLIEAGIRHIELDTPLCAFVADGIGSLPNSANAAAYILQVISALGYSPSPEALLETLQVANKKLLKWNYEQGEYYNSGTTLCGMVLHESGIFTLNVGDSEVLVLREGILNQITEHQVLDSAVANSPLTSFLGTSRDGLQAVIGTNYQRYREGDIIIITSDGLRKVYSNKELTELLQAPGSLASRAEGIYYEILKDGAPDNIGVILIQGGITQ